MKRKDFEIFSSNELKDLLAFTQNAVKEDKKIHGISDKDTNINKTKNLTNNFYNQEKSKTVSMNNTVNISNQFQTKKDDKKPILNPTIKKPLEKNPFLQIKKEEKKLEKEIKKQNNFIYNKKVEIPNVFKQQNVEKTNKESISKIPKNIINIFDDKTHKENNKANQVKIESKIEKERIEKMKIEEMKRKEKEKEEKRKMEEMKRKEKEKENGRNEKKRKRKG